MPRTNSSAPGDEFNYEGSPDPNKWTYEKGFVRNHELQWYQPENAFCEKGMLILEGRREKKPNPEYQAGSKDWRKSRKGNPSTPRPA